MKKEEAIKIIRKELSCVDRDNCKREECKSCDLVMPSKEPIIEAYKMAIDALEKEPKWIPVVERPLTDEEREEYGEDAEFMYDCILPEDGQEVLVSTPYGVRQTRFFTDYGYYFEDYEDKGEVIAWMSLPDLYKSETEKI